MAGKERARSGTRERSTSSLVDANRRQKNGGSPLRIARRDSTTANKYLSRDRGLEGGDRTHNSFEAEQSECPPHNSAGSGQYLRCEVAEMSSTNWVMPEAYASILPLTFGTMAMFEVIHPSAAFSVETTG